MGYYTGDDGTVANRTTVQADWLLLSVKPTSYWYSSLGPANTCNDYSAYTKLSLAVRYPATTRFGFNVVIQDVDAASCSQLTQHTFNVTTLINAATPVDPDNWLHLDLPLTNFGTFDAKSLKATHTAVPTTTMLFSLAGQYQSRMQDSAIVQGSKMGQRLLSRKKFGL
ncbi:hypothetical protein BG000_000481 [Podila horticola]|nr:hypothetical protein BG000_000481 [Podila horticola]